MEDEWDPNDFGFFYPDMPSFWGTDELIDRDNSTYCRTPHCFVRCLCLTQLGDHGRTNPHTLCRNLPSCLLGKAHTWWLEQNPIIQKGLIYCDDVEQWCRLLLGAFASVDVGVFHRCFYFDISLLYGIDSSFVTARDKNI